MINTKHLRFSDIESLLPDIENERQVLESKKLSSTSSIEETTQLLIRRLFFHCFVHGKDHALELYFEDALELVFVSKSKNIDFARIADNLANGGWLALYTELDYSQHIELIQKIHNHKKQFPINELLDIFSIRNTAPYAWMKSTFENIILPILRVVSDTGDIQTISIIFDRLIPFYALKITDENEYDRFTDLLSPITHKVAAKIRSNCYVPFREPNDNNSNAKLIAFVLRDGHLSGARVPLSIVDGIKKTNSRKLIFQFHILSQNITPSLERNCYSLGIDIFRYGEKNKVNYDDLRAMQSNISDRANAIIVWAAPPWEAPIYFSLELGKHQLLLSQHLKPNILSKYIDTYIFLSYFYSVKQNKNEIMWTSCPLALFDIGMPSTPKVQYTPNNDDTIKIGTICRPEKLNSEEFMTLLANILKKYEHVHFYYTGIDKNIDVSRKFSELNIQNNCHFIGWVQPEWCIQEFDIYIDSFPMSSGMTAIEAMASGVPMTAMISEYSLLGRDLVHILQADNLSDNASKLRAQLSNILSNMQKLGISPVSIDANQYYQTICTLIENTETRQRYGELLKELVALTYTNTKNMGMIFMDIVNSLEVDDKK